MHTKRVLRVVGIAVLVCVACCVGAWGYLCTSNLRNAKTVGNIPAPMGYTRVFENTSIEKDTRSGGSYAEFLRKLPLMCAEGNTPARDAHIVRNYNPFRNPWTIFDSDDEVLRVGGFHFNKNELRHY